MARCFNRRSRCGTPIFGRPKPSPPPPGWPLTPASVRNISGNMSSDGTLTWDAPEGEWIVLRTGMTPTGVTNAPASPEGSGLEVDKMNRAAVARHFDAYVGRALKLLDPKERGAFKFVVADSYEMGPAELDRWVWRRVRAPLWIRSQAVDACLEPAGSWAAPTAPTASCGTSGGWSPTRSPRITSAACAGSAASTA